MTEIVLRKGERVIKEYTLIIITLNKTLKLKEGEFQEYYFNLELNSLLLHPTNKNNTEFFVNNNKPFKINGLSYTSLYKYGLLYYYLHINMFS